MIRVQNLTVKYKRVYALNNVSLKINKGEIVALVGQNGAGKTTLLNEIISLIPGRVGLMPESTVPDSNLTVEEFLLYLSGAKVDSVITMCGLEDKRTSLCGTLSKGTKQRVILALALSIDSDVLLLDEPSAGLDPLFQKEMLSLIRKISRNRTLIISTHNISEIEDLATRIIVLRNGEISYDGKLDKKRSYYEYF